jgi:hypothetical protein
MNNKEQKTGSWSEIGILQGIAAFAICVVLAPTPSLARQMECSYDYTTHVTTLQLDDLGATNGSISYSFTHSISPTGGEEMFLFRGSDPARLRGTGQLEFIVEKLFFDPQETPSAIEFVDFDRPTLKEFQFPAAYLEQSVDTISAPLVVWSCHRTD